MKRHAQWLVGRTATVGYNRALLSGVGFLRPANRFPPTLTGCDPAERVWRVCRAHAVSSDNTLGLEVKPA